MATSCKAWKAAQFTLSARRIDFLVLRWRRRLSLRRTMRVSERDPSFVAESADILLLVTTRGERLAAMHLVDMLADTFLKVNTF